MAEFDELMDEPAYAKFSRRLIARLSSRARPGDRMDCGSSPP